MARIFITILLLLAAQSVHSQPTEYDIKIGGDYHWGEAVSESRSEAISLARSDLIGRIVTVVVADQTYDIAEDDKEFSTFYRSTSRTISRMELRGLDHIATERPDGTFRALAYIHRDDYQRSIETERDRQIALADQAAEIEREDGLNTAIPWYYRAFLNTYYFPEPIYLTDDAGRSIEARQYYRRKLDRWADRISIRTGQPSGGLMPGNVLEMSIPLELTTGNRPVTTLDIGFDIAGYGTRLTVSGSTELYLERLPSRPVESFTLVFRPALEETRSNRDWQLLASEIGPFYRRNISIDFTPVMNINFIAHNIAGKAWRFTSRIENISISHLEWDFGDGTYSEEMHPAHTFRQLDPPPTVTLTLNRNPDLQVAKKVTPTGLKTVRAFGEERPPAPAITRPTRADSRRPEEPVRAERDEAIRDRVLPDRADIDPGTDQFRWRTLDLTPGKRAYLQQISREKDSGEILRSLQTHARGLDIRFGNSSAVQNQDNSFVAIVDPETYEVVAFITPVQHGRRTELHSGRRVINLAEEFRGLGSVWIEP